MQLPNDEAGNIIEPDNVDIPQKSEQDHDKDSNLTKLSNESTTETEKLNKAQRAAIRSSIGTIISASCAVAMLIYNLFLWNENKSNWVALNNPQVEIVSPRFVGVKAYACDDKPVFGYNDPLMTKDETDIGPGKCMLYSYVAVFRDSSAKILVNADREYTTDAMTQYLKDHGDSGHFFYAKRHIVEFGFKNVGKTDALNFLYTVQARVTDNTYKTIIRNDSSTTLSHDGNPLYTNCTFDLALPIKFPDSLNFVITCSYDDSHGVTHGKRWEEKWDRSTFKSYQVNR